MEASRYPKKEAEAIDEIQIIFNLNHYEKQLTFLSEQCILTTVLAYSVRFSFAKE